MLSEVTRAHIDRILAITDTLGIHREQVMIPLMPRKGGRIRRTPQGRIEIVVDAALDFEEWLVGLPTALRAVMG